MRNYLNECYLPILSCGVMYYAMEVVVQTFQFVDKINKCDLLKATRGTSLWFCLLLSTRWI